MRSRAPSSKQLMADIDEVNRELSKLGGVNKKAIDQFANFSDQRDNLLKRQREINEGDESIRELIDHLDSKKIEALQRTFKQVQKNFKDVFSELIPGGEGSLRMVRASEDAGADANDAAAYANFTGISLKVRFASGGDTQTMEQLSGGQKTMVA